MTSAEADLIAKAVRDALKTDLDGLRTELNERLDQVAERLDKRIDQVAEEVSQKVVEAFTEALTRAAHGQVTHGRRLDALEARVTALEATA